MPIDIEKIQDSPQILDILIQMEDVLDSLDIYVFKNWFNGEVCDGPNIKRYWLDFTLKYPYDKMPDPKAAYRLLKHGIRVNYEKVKEDDTAPDRTLSEPDVNEDKKDIEESPEYKYWMIKISIPRKLYKNISTEEMDFYDEEIEYDDVEDAKDTGMDEESAFVQDDAEAGLGGALGGGEPPEADETGTAPAATPAPTGQGAAKK